jgi:hypothetical protein
MPIPAAVSPYGLDTSQAKSKLQAMMVGSNDVSRIDTQKSYDNNMGTRNYFLNPQLAQEDLKRKLSLKPFLDNLPKKDLTEESLREEDDLYLNDL